MYGIAFISSLEQILHKSVHTQLPLSLLRGSLCIFHSMKLFYGVYQSMPNTSATTCIITLAQLHKSSTSKFWKMLRANSLGSSQSKNGISFISSYKKATDWVKFKTIIYSVAITYGI